MLRARVLVGVLSFLLLVSLIPATAHAAPTPAQRAQLAQAGRDLAAADRLARSNNLREARESLVKAQEALTELSAVEDVVLQRMLAPLAQRLEALHASLELKGVELPPLALVKPDLSKPAEKTPEKKPEPAANATSFVRDVAPMLVAKCGRCHVDEARGRFSMANFAALARGTEGAGVVIMPRNSRGSRIVEVIVEGDMPRGGGRVEAAELAALSKWIDEGANFDGPNLNVSLRDLVRGAAPAAPEAPPQPELKVVEATGKEESSFSRDVAPVMAASCTGCHGQMQPRGNLSVLTFERFLRGGDGGAMIVPGKPDDSLLVRKLKGMAGQRMPLNQPPLAADVIAKIEKWIAEGARFDGPSPQMEMGPLAAHYIARNATHEQLSRLRVEQAAAKWRLALPGEENAPKVIETDAFVLYGTVSDTVLQDVSKLVQEQWSKAAVALGAPGDQPPVKGRLTVYVFNQRYEYSEFGQMVEKRRLPNEWVAHWGYDVVDAYLCIMHNRNDEAAMRTAIAQQVAAVYVASRGADVPRWFAEGSGRAVASSIDSRDARVRIWDQRAAQINVADAFVSGRLSPEDRDIASYALIKQLKPGTRAFRQVLEALESGARFDVAFAQGFRRAPPQMRQGG